MNDDIQSKFNNIRLSYVENLKVKRAQINLLWESLQKGWQNESASELHLILHGLAGGAETFGFSDVSKKARSAVNLFREIEENSQLRVPQKMVAIETAINELDAVLQIAIS